MNEFDYVRIREDLYPAFAKLFRSSFNMNIRLEQIQKKFDTCYTGALHQGYFAIDKQTGNFAAFYGVFPMIAQFGNDRVLCAQSGDTMTHPNYRGKGLFIKLAKMTYDLCRDENIHFVFGFPNKNSYPGFVNKLKWIHYGDMKQYVIDSGFPFPTEKVIKRLHLEPLMNAFIEKKIPVTHAIKFENSIRITDPGYGFIPHDQQFINYKTYNKNFFYTLPSGVSINFRLDGNFWLGDISDWKKVNFDLTLNEIKQFARSMFVKYIYINVHSNTTADAILSELLTCRTTFPVGGINLTNKYDLTKMRFTSMDFDTY
ncbi:MAG: GNAT family N-acetyltransferase [Chitinophagales bacterium]|nr:GNAT family N-acetyltransferase [Chitinophagales bacterium]MDW8419619.1 GNAT family N-acetyltransferase [Chitinophagales bacterium]